MSYSSPVATVNKQTRENLFLAPPPEPYENHGCNYLELSAERAINIALKIVSIENRSYYK